MDTFCQSPATTNTQEENVNVVLTGERLNNLDTLAETLKGLTINNSGYYNSDKNDAEGDPARYPKVANHNSEGKKRKVADTSNRKFQQTLLINWTLPIITMKIDHQIENKVATSRASTIKLVTPRTTEVITNAARGNAQ